MSVAVLLTAITIAAGAAAAPRAKAKPARASGKATAPKARRVLDVEKLRIVTASPRPNAIPTCDVLVMGGGLGGVAAAEALAKQGRTVILAEPTSWLGGQLTSQGVSLPDENSYIEQNPGVGTQAYRSLREELRAKYAAMPGIKPGREKSVGVAWVSRITGEPAVWEEVIRARLDALRGSSGIREIHTRTQLVEVKRFPHNNRYQYADLVHLDTGRITRVAARYLLDATELGDGVALAGSPWTVGAEARSAYGEPHAPETARPDWIQSFTYCFAVRWQPEGPHRIVEKPAEYEYFKSLGEYTLGYDYIDRGRIFYKVFERVPGAGGPFWTYRRIIAASSFANNPKYAQDLALINWRGNDFHEENPIGKPLEEQVRILKRAKDFAQGFLYWLQTECPRDDGSGVGYPEMQLAADAMGTADGFAMYPYIRESRRIKGQFTLTEQHLAPDPENPEKKWGEEFFDTVGIALYSMDIHPSKGEPPFLSRALPYHLPLGSFIPRSGPDNVLPAAKNFGASRLALSSARMHPTEWLAGEVAGHLAAFCLGHRVRPEEVRGQPELLRKFQTQLEQGGVPLRWSEIIK
ncbi:MAG: FAD-dependent oxidoreductase [Armatimonadota bacterium]